MFLYKHMWDPPGMIFVIVQYCQHHFQCIESDIQLCTKFPGHNPLICMDELIEALFILWVDSYAGLLRTWPMSCITFTTAETHHPLPHCSHIFCLVSVNVQQASMNVNGCNFSAWRNSVTPLLCMHFHVRCHFARLLLWCYLPHSNKTYKLVVARFSLCCHTTSIHL
jgi:hypothetical protein